MAKNIHPHKISWKKDAPGFNQNYTLNQLRGLTIEQIARMDVPQLAGVLRSAQKEFNRKVGELQKNNLYSYSLDRFYENLLSNSFEDKQSVREYRQELRQDNNATLDLIRRNFDKEIVDWNAPLKGTFEKQKIYKETQNIIYNRKTKEYETAGDYSRFAKQKMTWQALQYVQFLNSATSLKTGIIADMEEMQKNLGLADIGRKLTQTELSFIWSLVDEFRKNPMGNMYDLYSIINSNVLIEMFGDEDNRPKTYREAFAYMEAHAQGLYNVKSWESFKTGEVSRNARKKETIRRSETDDENGEDSEYAGNELGKDLLI